MPSLTQSMAFGALSASGGDVIAQLIQQRIAARDPQPHSHRLDVSRSLRMGLIASCWTVPNLFNWYTFLDWMMPQRNLRWALIKVVASQTIWSVYLNGTIMGIEAYGRTRSLDYSVQKVRSELYNVLTTSWCIWPLQNLLNFYFVPVHTRAVVDSTMAFFWGIYMAWVCARDLPSGAQSGPPPVTTATADH
eukprot:EG_transcript_29820